MPIPGKDTCTDNDIKQQNEQGCIEIRIENLAGLALLQGNIQRAFRRAMAYAGQTSKAFRRTDHFLFLNLKKRRTVPAAGPAVHTLLLVPSDFYRT